MKKTNNDALIGEMDAFAAELLAGTKNDKTTVQAKIDVFRTITQWVGVRNRIAVEEGADLDDIRDKLKADAPAGAPVKRRGRPPKSAAAGSGTGGSALAAIRRKLPRQNGGDAGSDSGGAQRQGAVADSGGGSVRADAGDDF